MDEKTAKITNEKILEINVPEDKTTLDELDNKIRKIVEEKIFWENVREYIKTNKIRNDGIRTNLYNQA